MSKITIEEKRNVIEELLSKGRFDRPQKRILEHVASDETLLNEVKFINGGAHYCYRGLYIPEYRIESPKFLKLFSGHYTFSNASTIIDELTEVNDKPLSIHVDLPRYLEYITAGVLEDNREDPDYLELLEDDKYRADSLVKYLEAGYELDALRKEIDNAIDSKDVDKFKKLSNKFTTKYNKLKKIKTT